MQQCIETKAFFPLFSEEFGWTRIVFHEAMHVQYTHTQNLKRVCTHNMLWKVTAQAKGRYT